MGVLSGKDLFSPKWPTAIIIDSVGTAHFFQIKNPLGPYFITEINNEIFGFDTRGLVAKWRQSLAKTFEFQIFFTDCYKPISPYMKDLELIMKKNNLPKLSVAMYKMFSLLKLREKKKFENFKIKKLIEELNAEKEKNPERFAQYKDVIRYLEDLGIDEIVTPVRRTTEYLDETFIAPDPQYFGSLKTGVKDALVENREINHKPITSKKGWVKIMAVMLLIIVIGLVVWFAYDKGAFDGIMEITGSFDAVGDAFRSASSPPSAVSVDSLASRYPTPESAKAAIDAGQVKLSDFPPNIQELIKNVPTPKASP